MNISMWRSGSAAAAMVRRLSAERERCQVMPADVCAERCDWFCIATIEDEGDELAPSGA